jgi:hypothetical protein
MLSYDSAAPLTLHDVAKASGYSVSAVSLWKRRKYEGNNAAIALAISEVNSFTFLVVTKLSDNRIDVDVNDSCVQALNFHAKPLDRDVADSGVTSPSLAVARVRPTRLRNLDTKAFTDSSSDIQTFENLPREGNEGWSHKRCIDTVVGVGIDPKPISRSCE